MVFTTHAARSASMKVLVTCATVFRRPGTLCECAPMERYVIRGGQLGYDRLQVLARSWEPTTLALLDRIGLRDGMRCLDLGCGTGAVTFELARRVGPGGNATGVDMDEVKLDLARRAAADQGLTNVAFDAMNVYEWAAPGAYDLVYCRFLLQHLRRPVDVLRTMWDAVKVGGVIVVEDADFEGSFCDPPNEGFAFWVEAYQRALEGNGGDPLSGRKLHRHFSEAGIPTPSLTVVQRADLTGEAKTMPHATVLATADAIIGQGLATADEVNAALEQLLTFADDPGSLYGSPRVFQAWSRRTSA
jgi:SAM-dependent methyltransferase